MSGYREGLAADRPAGPAWTEHVIDAEARERIRKRIDEGVLARTPGPRVWSRNAASWALVVVMFALPSLAFGRVGIVESTAGASPTLGALAYGAMAALLARAIFAWWQWRPEDRPSGRLLVPAGVVEETPGRVRIAPADRIVSIAFGSRLTIQLDDGETIEIRRIERDDPREDAETLERVLGRGEAIRRARAQESTTELERLELMSARTMTESLVAPRRARAQLGAATVSLVIGVVTAVLLFTLGLPSLALRWTPHEASVHRWRAIARTYPLAWVGARASAGIDRRRNEVRAAVLGRASLDCHEALDALFDWLATHDTAQVLVEVVPPADADVDVSTRDFHALAPPDRPPAPIAMGLASGEARELGARSAASSLASALDAPRDVIDVRASRGSGARIVLVLRARAVAPLVYDDAVLAALELTVVPQVVLPGQEPRALGAPIVVDAASAWPVDGHPGVPRELQSITGRTSPGTTEVYVRQIERAVANATYELGHRIWNWGRIVSHG